MWGPRPAVSTARVVAIKRLQHGLVRRRCAGADDWTRLRLIRKRYEGERQVGNRFWGVLDVVDSPGAAKEHRFG